jgi:hypothetical protein
MERSIFTWSGHIRRKSAAYEHKSKLCAFAGMLEQNIITLTMYIIKITPAKSTPTATSYKPEIWRPELPYAAR